MSQEPTSASRPPKLPSDPAARFGKYIRTDKLGAGGGGEVWKAWDTELGRWVALKFLTQITDEEIARFKREAQLAARLSHPNIAAIHEVGEAHGRPYLAMQYIDGGTLTLRRHRDRRVLAGWIRDACVAIAHAHKHGVVHRDLKPDNLMLDLQERLYVCDFGLARPVDRSSALTSAGVAVGTPSYMSPEQARGGDVTAATDVYGIGATLYALLTGKPPFGEANVLDTLMAVIEKEPAPPRSLDATIDPDLETIVLKCLEKDPARRYPAMTELAGDLQLWLEGDIISARRTSVVYRLRKRLAKRKALVAGCVVAALVVAGSLGAVAWHRAESERARRDLVEQMRRTSDAALDAALALRRAGDIEGMKAYAARVEEACRGVVDALPRSPEPHYRLGRIYRAQMRDREALDEQDRALAKDSAFAPALYERVILRWLFHVDRARAMQRAAGRDDPKTPPLDQIARDDPRARELAAGLERDVEALGTADTGVARGLRAWISGDRALARRLLDGHKIEVAYEALALLAESERNNDEALSWWTRGRDHDRGYFPFLEGEAHALLNRAGDDPAGRDAVSLHERAIALYSEALAKGADPARILFCRAWGRMNLGAILLTEGRDPTDVCEAAVRDFDEVVRRSPDDATAFAMRGTAKYNLAQWRNASDLYDDAIEDTEAAIRADPANFGAWSARVRFGFTFVQAARRAGRDPLPVLDSAIRRAEEAVQRFPARTSLLVMRGNGRWEASRVDPARAAEHLAAAEADGSRALDLEPASVAARRLRAQARLDRGIHALRARADAAAHFEGVIADCDVLTRDAPRLADGWAFRASARCDLGLVAERDGDDPTPHYRAAIPDFDEAIRLAPQRVDYREWRAGALSNWARRALSQRLDATPILRKAVEDYTEALRREPRRVESLRGRAGARGLLAETRAAHDEDVIPTLDLALADADMALQVEPSGESHFERGRVRYLRGFRLHAGGKDGSADLRAALADFSRAAELDPANAARSRAMVADARRLLND